MWGKEGSIDDTKLKHEMKAASHGIQAAPLATRCVLEAYCHLQAECPLQKGKKQKKQDTAILTVTSECQLAN